MKRYLSLISLMFVFIVSLFFVACGEKKQKDIDLNGDGIVEEWEKNFKGIKASQTKVDADIEVSNVEEFNNLSNKIVELQTRIPQQATDDNGQLKYDEETQEPIYIPETLPILNPVVKLTKDIDFNGEEIDCQDLKGATFFGNNKVLKNFKLRVFEESQGEFFNHYNLLANAKSVTELYVFMGYQSFSLEQINAGGNNHIDFTLFRDCYKLENITVKGMFNVVSKSNVELNLSLLSYNSEFFEFYSEDELLDEEEEDSQIKEIEGVNIANCNVIGRISYSDDNEESDPMKSVNISGLSVISLLNYEEQQIFTEEISNNVVNNSVDVMIDFNKKKNSTSLTGTDVESLSASDFIGCENVNISGVLSSGRESGDIVIDNCTSNMSLNINKMYLVAAIGGISGSNNFDSVIKNCKSTVSIIYGESIDADKYIPTITIGGIVGNTRGKVLACDATLNIEMGKNSASLNIGGIAGRMISNGEISNCNVNTNIKCNGATPQGYVIAGGLAGYFENSLAYNNNMSGDIVAEQYIRTILGGFIGASVDSTGIRNMCHVNITNTNSRDSFVSSLLGVAYGGNYESCMSTGTVNATGYIYERTEVKEKDEYGNILETPVVNFGITGYTNISVGLFFNYPFRNPERYNFSETGDLSDIENVNQNGEVVSTHQTNSDEWFDIGLQIDRFKDNNKVIYNVYKDNSVGEEDDYSSDKESLNSLTAVPSIKNCLILSKHHVQYLNLDEKATDKQLYNPKDVFKYIALNGLWASQNEGQYSYNTTIYLNNVQVYDLESTTASAVSLLTVNNYGDSTIFGIIGSTQIKQMTNITRDNVWGCVRVYDKELLISDEDIATAVKNAKFATGEATSYYDKELSLSGAGGEMFDLIIQSNYVKDTSNDSEEEEDENIDDSLYKKSLQDEINTLIAYSINQLGKVSDRIFTINFIMNIKSTDIESLESTSGIITGNNADSWENLNAFEQFFILMVDRTVNDIIFVDESKLSEDATVEENGKYVTIRYASVRDGVSYVDAYKFQRINVSDFKTYSTEDQYLEEYYSLRVTMYFSTSRAE